MTVPTPTPEVAAVFAAASSEARQGLLALRDLIFRTAAETPQVGPVTEALRWGEPAYLTPETRSGSTIRIGIPKSGGFALFCNCNTSLINDFRNLAGDACQYEGNRAVLFARVEDIDPPLISILITRALTWHHRRRG